MVAVPVRMYKAARRERVKFHHVYAPEPEQPVEEHPEPAPLSTRSSKVVHEFPRPSSPHEETEPEDPPVMARVHQRQVGEDSSTSLPPSAIMKGYEVEKGNYVVVKKEEIAAL